jgi:uncharacterized protein YukE
VTNPLVAPSLDTPKDFWAGVWIVEDIQLIQQGVKEGSWIDATLGVVGASLDALAFVSDPVGALLQYGIAWLIEHVKSLSEALDWLAGDPGQIAAHAKTWRNVGIALQDNVNDLLSAAHDDVARWHGPAAEAYQVWASQQRNAINGLAKAAETMAAITEGAGMLIAAVRVLVRDAIATVVSRLIVYGAELACSLGAAAPLVIEQVSTLVASWAAKIARWLKALLSSLRALLPIVRRLSELIDELKKILSRLRSHPHVPDQPREPREPAKPVDPKVEEQRAHDLGMDPATGKFRPAEAETALRIEDEVGVTLTRAPSGSSADWVDDAGRTYDAVGNFPAQYFERQWPQLQYQIERHLDKADLVPVDVSRFSADQVAKIVEFIADRKLGPRVFIVGQ